MSFSSFIRSSSLEGVERVTVEGQCPLDHFEAMQDQITALAGPALGKLFCEPLISEGNGTASTTVSWYGAHEGEATALTSLGPGERSAAEALLRARIEALQPVIAAAKDGQLIAAALYIRDMSDVFVVAGEPVLTNWGLLPDGAQASNTKRTAAFATGLGALGLALIAPPLAASEFSDWRDRLPGGAVGAIDDSPRVKPDDIADPAQMTDVAAAVPVGTVIVDDHLPWYRRAWAPALLATIIAALVLIVLLIPGVLLAPRPTAADQINDQARLLEDSNRSLEERLEQLRNAQAQGVCTADGNFEVGLPPAAPGAVENGTPSVTPAPNPDPAGEVPPPAPTDESLLPPPLDNLRVPDVADSRQDAATLLDVVDSSTVLILASGNAQIGIGSGFFVAPGLVVTNDHVIANGAPDQLYVTSQALGQVVRVELIARTGTSADSKVDFALLKGDFGPQRPFAISDQATRLSHVVAAGFPLVVSSEDARFQRLLEQNDPTAAPSTSTTRGVVTSIQSQTDGTEVIAHDAEINQGNSGGPLLDLCGRVVGVNTYLLRNEETNAVARFALHSRELRQFLDANAVPATYTSDACNPVSVSRPPAPAAHVAVENQGPATDLAEAVAPAAEVEPAVEPSAAQEAPIATEDAPAVIEETAPEAPQPDADPALEAAAEPAEEAAADPARATSVAPPTARSVSSREAGLPDGVVGDRGLAPE